MADILTKAIERARREAEKRSQQAAPGPVPRTSRRETERLWEELLRRQGPTPGP